MNDDSDRPESGAEDELLAPRRVERTGDDTPAATLAGYVWRMTGHHQICVCALAAAVAGLSVVPIELQRRIIDTAIEAGDRTTLIWLASVYLGVLAAERLGKFALELYRGWLSESAVRYTRGHLAGLYCARIADGSERDDGRAVSIIGPEVDQLGGFAGDGPSRAVASLAILLGVGLYMLFVEPVIAAVAVAFLLPQAVLAPLLQRRLNALAAERVERARALSQTVSEEIDGGDNPTGPGIDAIYRTRMRIHFWKALLKGMLNALNAAGPLVVLAFGGWLAIRGETTVGTIVAFVSGFQRLSDPVRELIAVYRQTAQVAVQHRMIARWM